MSLDTVLKIGKALRQTENSLKYFKYVQPCPVQNDKDGNSIYPLCLTIPVNEDFSFDWDNVKITPENEIADLYYLNFTTSDSDSSPKKFGFGDISYTRKSEIDKAGKLKGTKDYGNFTFEKGDSKNAFLNGQNVFQEIKNEYLTKKINLFAVGIQNLKERQVFVRQLLKGYNENKPVSLPKTLQKFSDKVEPIVSDLKKEEDLIELFTFQKIFNSELSKFNLLLLYAPAFEYILENNRGNFIHFLQTEDELKSIFVKVTLEKHLSKVKKLFEKEEKLDDLSENAKNAILKYADFSVYIHFDFQGKHWHQYDKSFSLIKEKLNSELADTTEMGIVPSKSIYRTLCSGNDKNDIQFPFFDIEKRHKSFAFKNSLEFEDFLYTHSILKKGIRKIYGTDIELYVFPAFLNGEEEISAEDYIDFFFSKKDETKIAIEPIFPFFLDEKNTKIKRFDFVFSDSSGNTTNDLIEISGIEKSKLRQTKLRIESISLEVKKEKSICLRSPDDFHFKIENSFTQILGKAETEKDSKTRKTKVVFKNKTKSGNGFKSFPKYKSHLLKVLPAIYTGSYYEDLILLPALIQNIEYAVRNSDPSFIRIQYFDLKYSLMFLLKIQNTQNDKFMEITNAESYQIGVKLGKLSRPLKKAINSFEKNYVGLLTRRVSTKDECIKFYNEINEKLIMHKKNWGQSSAEIASDLINLPSSKYNKEKLAFGFFEGYFKYEVADKKKDFFVRLEKLLLDYEGNQELESELEMLNTLFQDIKN